MCSGLLEKYVIAVLVSNDPLRVYKDHPSLVLCLGNSCVFRYRASYSDALGVGVWPFEVTACPHAP